MHEHPDATLLLRSLAADCGEDGFDPDAPAARASLERILAEPPLGEAPLAEPPHRRRPTRHLRAARGPGSAHRRRPARRLAFAATVPVALAVAGFAVVTSFGGPRAGIAQAAVIARAAQALAPTDSILYLQVQQYSAVNGGPCLLGGRDEAMCVGTSPPNPGTGISANPADDTLTDSFQEWASPDASIRHILYGGGDEIASSAGTDEFSAYDAADNTITTLTDVNPAELAPPPTSATPTPDPSVPDLQSPAYYENLYQQAQAGTLNAQLIGQTTIGNESVYELQFNIDPQPPANPPPGDYCGKTVCMPTPSEVLLYLDSQTFEPVRTVELLLNNTDQPGIPDGTSVWNVTNLTVQSLPDTPANESLLAMTAHPGATQTTETEAQYRAQLDASLQAQVAANAARAGTGDRKSVV